LLRNKDNVTVMFLLNTATSISFRFSRTSTMQ
jgi:hypothetical protein